MDSWNAENSNSKPCQRFAPCAVQPSTPSLEYSVSYGHRILSGWLCYGYRLWLQTTAMVTDFCYAYRLDSYGHRLLSGCQISRIAEHCMRIPLPQPQLNSLYKSTCFVCMNAVYDAGFLLGVCKVRAIRCMCGVYADPQVPHHHHRELPTDEGDPQGARGLQGRPHHGGRARRADGPDHQGDHRNAGASRFTGLSPCTMTQIPTRSILAFDLQVRWRTTYRSNTKHCATDPYLPLMLSVHAPGVSSFAPN